MLLRMTHYITALIFLTALSVVYENMVAPWMQPPVVTAIELKPAGEIRRNDSLADLFPEGAWQRGNCKQLQSSSGMLLFGSWKQIAGDRWKLWPITVVIGRGMAGNSSDSPIIIDAAEGADISFTESLDVMSGGAPPIRQGRIIGPVRIRRVGSDSATQEMNIHTANVGIDSRKIWTTETIKMDFGKARMAGRDLTIYLAGAGQAGGEAATVLDRLELIYLDELVLPLNMDQPNGTPSGPSAQVSIRCGGRVEYDFAIDELSLRDSVALIHQPSSGAADQFHCDALRLRLNDPSNDLLVRENPLDWLVKIVATGSPAHAVLPSYDAELTADSIDFNAITGLIRAQGESGVRVRRGGIEASLSQLAYQFDPQRPGAIGSIDVQGAGIVNVNDPKIPLLRAHWRDGFKLQPTSSTTAKELHSKFELSIDGDVQAVFSDGGEFNADNVYGVLKPKTITALDTRNQGGNRNQIGQAGGEAKPTLVPERFKATGDVRLDTAAIAVETQELILYFVDAVRSSTDLPNSDASRPGGGRVSQSSQPSTLRQWVAQPMRSNSAVLPVARPRPTIRGDLITAKLQLDDEGVNANDLSVIGRVNLTHSLTAGRQRLPVKLTGELLRLIDGGGEDVLQLQGAAGAPARLELGDGFFTGPLIQIRPNHNEIRMNSAGEFQIPSTVLPQSMAADASSKIQWTSAPHCRWKGEMFFDGRSAVLTGGVDIRASMLNGRESWEVQMRGDRLQVDLMKNVQVRNVQTMKDATIQRVTLSQSEETPVLVQALRRAADGVLESKHLLHASRLTLTPGSGVGNSIASGNLIGDGPGWYRGWMLPSAKQKFAGNGGTAPAAPKERQLTGIHLQFNDSMHGDLAGKSLQFLRGVRVGVRSVDDWNETFEASSMDAISMGDSTLDCDRLKFNVAPTANRRIASTPTPWEMEATSGVVFRTRSDRGLIEGTASRASYSSAKDLFVVEGSPNRAATFRQTPPNGQTGPEAAVKTMTLRPSTMEIRDMQPEWIRFATPPSSARR